MNGKRETRINGGGLILLRQPCDLIYSVSGRKTRHAPFRSLQFLYKARREERPPSAEPKTRKVVRVSRHERWHSTDGGEETRIDGDPQTTYDQDSYEVHSVPSLSGDLSRNILVSVPVRDEER